MKNLFLLGGCLIALSSCGRYDISTAQDIEILITGSEGAYCQLSTPYNRYELKAPGVAMIERDRHDMTVDCKDNFSDRRRVKTIEAHFGLGFWNYPESVTMDFAQLDNGHLKNGFRSNDGKLTEKSFSRPLVDVYEENAVIEQEPQLELNSFDTMIEQEIFVNEQGQMPAPLFEGQISPATQIDSNAYGNRRSYPVPLD